MFYKSKNLGAGVESYNYDEIGVSAGHSGIHALVEEQAAQINHLKEELHRATSELTRTRRLRGEMSASLSDMLTIQSAAEIITSHLDFENIARSVLERFASILDITSGNLFIYSGDSMVPVLDDQVQAYTDLMQQLEADGIINWLWDKKSSIVIPLGEFSETSRVLFGRGVILCAPLITNDHAHGLLLIHTTKRQDAFSKNDLQLANTLCIQAAIAIQYTSIYKKLQRTHKEYEKSQAYLLRTVKMATIGEIAGGVAHEINNPLQILIGKLQLAGLSMVDEEAYQIINTQAMRISTIIRGLTSLSQDAGKNKCEEIDIDRVIHSALELIRTQLTRQKITISLQTDQPLPVVIGDSVNLKQVILNFLVSARRRMSAGGELLIKAARADDRRVLIEIADTGSVIPQRVIEYLKEPFNSISSSIESESYFSFFVSFQLIRDMGGNVTIQADDTYSNRIAIQLPAQSTDEGE